MYSKQALTQQPKREGNISKNSKFKMHLLFYHSKIISNFLSFINSFSNIMSHILIVKFYPFCCCISISSRFFQVLSFCCHTKDTASVCNDLVSVKFCSGMEAIVTIVFIKFLQPVIGRPLSYFTGYPSLASTTHTAALSSN